jgi:hypothetical protein
MSRARSAGRAPVATLRRAAGIAVAVAALLSLSCASSNELAKRSDRSMAEGQSRRAYDWAKKALDKDPRNDKARASMTTAATAIASEWKTRIRNQAAGDSLAAAETALEFAHFRAELASYQVVLTPDPTFREDERQILTAAAAHDYKSALQGLADHHPKQAYLDFSAAGRYVPGYRDLATRIPRTYEMALTRVAILPFANETDVPGLSKEMAERIYGEVDDHRNPKLFTFTRLVDTDQVYGRMTVSQLERLGRDDAIRIGRQLGAQRVVWGRFSGMNASSGMGLYHEKIYRHYVDPDPSVANRDRYEESDFTAITRERTVTAKYEFEVIDTDDESALAHRGDVVKAVANTVYTPFQARGSCDDYCLLPPALRDRDASRADQLDKEWTATFGNWTLSKLLFQAREGHGRTKYRPEYRKEFFSASYIFPVFLDDLPSANDLALVALDQTWKPVWETLRDLDGQENAGPAGGVAGR